MLTFLQFCQQVLEPLYGQRLSSILTAMQTTSDSGRANSPRSREILREWLQLTRQQKHCSDSLSMHDWVSLLVPEEDVDRKYHLRETTLHGLLVDIFRWHEDLRCHWLGTWQFPMHDDDRTAGDFSLRFEILIASEITASPQPKSIKLTALQRLLDELASHCSYSANLTPAECRWMCRILLKDLKLPCDSKRIFRSIHVNFYDIYTMRNSLKAACACMETLLDDDENVEKWSDKSLWLTPALMTNIGIMSSMKARCIADIIKKSKGKRVAVETKYDGERIQVHVDFTKPNESFQIRIFSKSRRDSTWEREPAHRLIRASFGRFDASNQWICSLAHNSGKPLIHSAIVEGELMTYYEATDSIDSFGTVRNFDPDLKRNEDRHFIIIWFELLMLNERSLMNQRFIDRRNILQQSVFLAEKFIHLSDMKIFDTSEPKDQLCLSKYYAELIAKREEGVIVKPLDSPYVPGSEEYWMKLKRDYIEGLGDTADFAVIGGCLATKTSSKFTKGENRIGGLIGSYIVACLENKQDMKWPNRRAKFRVAFKVEAGFSEAQTELFDAKTRTNRVKAGASYQEAFEVLPYDVYFDKSGIYPSNVHFFFEEPYVFELLGGSFVKEAGDNFYTLRFPRIKRERTDIGWRDTVSFQEYQDMAFAALAPMSVSERDRLLRIIQGGIKTTSKREQESGAGQQKSPIVKRYRIELPVSDLTALLVAAGARPCIHERSNRVSKYGLIVAKRDDRETMDEIRAFISENQTNPPSLYVINRSTICIPDKFGKFTVILG